MARFDTHERITNLAVSPCCTEHGGTTFVLPLSDIEAVYERARLLDSVGQG
jgi:hypothetical protein